MRKVKIKDLTPSRPDKEWSLTDPKRGLESERFQQRPHPLVLKAGKMRWRWV